MLMKNPWGSGRRVTSPKPSLSMLWGTEAYPSKTENNQIAGSVLGLLTTSDLHTLGTVAFNENAE